MNNTYQFEVLIIGSGAAGLGLALSLADQAKIALISKDTLMAGSSQHAQGGIAAVMDQEDSFELHIQDTLNAGAGLCNRNVVAHVITHAKSAIQWLTHHGVQFSTQDDQRFHLTREGGHSYRRILHVADKTGAVVVKTLADQVLLHPHITCFEEHTAIDLLIQNNQCYGALILDNHNNHYKFFTASITILATGGASTIYLHTSNPEQTSGDGIAMAWRAGCRIANLEFNQFHPTTLYHPAAHSFLITEAVRGEGGRLLLPNSNRFMHQYNQRAELASRDIVARAIDNELKTRQIDCVYLDISHKPADMIKKHFPTIYQQCLNINIDITQQPIPVVPAAHYTCGGVITNLFGQTDINALYAIGEVACTGMHGANRMASNSLLECLVFAMNAGRTIKHQLQQIKHKQIPQFYSPSKTTADIDQPNIAEFTFQLRQTMWNYVGIVRNNDRLQTAQQIIQSIKQKVDQLFTTKHFTKSFIELRNLMIVSDLIVRCALARKESRGLHYNLDYPETTHTAKDTILIPHEHDCSQSS